jgi:hypothetical protein
MVVPALVVAMAGVAPGGPGDPQEKALVRPLTEDLRIDGADYPDPLRFDDGEPVTTTAEWEQERRPELLDDFRENVYGEGLPDSPEESFAVTSTAFPGGTRKIGSKITIDGPEGTGSFGVTLFVPKTDGTPRGTFLMIDHRGAVRDDPGRSSGYAPVSTILAAGYAFASFDVGDVAPDDSRSYREQDDHLFHPADEPLPDDAGRAVSAWAWGASRAMDYLQTDPDLDPARVAVIGHSRSGKAALWAGAQDTRFAAVVANDSGLDRGQARPRGTGEGARRPSPRSTARSRTGSRSPTRPSGDRVSELPVDQHELLALIAPRRVVVGSAGGDANADPRASSWPTSPPSRCTSSTGWAGRVVLVEVAAARGPRVPRPGDELPPAIRTARPHRGGLDDLPGRRPVRPLTGDQSRRRARRAASRRSWPAGENRSTQCQRASRCGIGAGLEPHGSRKVAPSGCWSATRTRLVGAGRAGSRGR